MLSDIEIAQGARLQPVTSIAARLGISPDLLELYGTYKAKVKLSVLEQFKDRPNGKYVDVTAITPTPLGEGKTVTTIGLGLGLNAIGRNATVCIRQPSLGPTFGIKGGAAGGGYAQVVPMEDFNLHLTGDTHAVGAAHNLLAAFLDNSVLKGNPLDIDPFTITWRRVVDLSDRMLRNIVIGLGGKQNGYPRESGFDITVASEIMAILALSINLKDLRERLGRIVVALNSKRQPVTAEQVGCAGAMAALLKDALLPNLMQTIENTPVFVHTGPFGNIAHGNSSILADMIALKCSDYVITESGFGADIGFEKFMDIKCRVSGLMPDAVVLVCSVRALKMHSGSFKVVAGKPLPEGLMREDIPALEAGCCNLIRHIENVRLFGLPVVVAINRFAADTDAEIEALRRIALDSGAFAAAVSEVHARGGKGGTELAEAVVDACDAPSKPHFLYPLDAPIEDKIHAIATKIYGASDVDYILDAKRQIKLFKEHGYGSLPICMAKTHLSLSHDPQLKGAPSGFEVPIREVRASVGAGFLYPLLGAMSTMPGLPKEPGGTRIDINVETGRIIGLS